MKAQEFLDKANAALRERGAEYENANSENSMHDIVRAFNRHLYILGKDACLTEEDGWIFMIDLKLTRFLKALRAGKFHEDSVVDLIGYIAKLGERLSIEYPVFQIAEPAHAVRGDECEGCNSTDTLYLIERDGKRILSCSSCGEEW